VSSPKVLRLIRCATPAETPFVMSPLMTKGDDGMFQIGDDETAHGPFESRRHAEAVAAADPPSNDASAAMTARVDRKPDRELLLRLIEVLQVSKNNLRRDPCGDWNIFGRRGHISTDRHPSEERQSDVAGEQRQRHQHAEERQHRRMRVMHRGAEPDRMADQKQQRPCSEG
jgi:hypothetical protein